MRPCRRNIRSRMSGADRIARGWLQHAKPLTGTRAFGVVFNEASANPVARGAIEVRGWAIAGRTPGKQRLCL